MKGATRLNQTDVIAIILSSCEGKSINNLEKQLLKIINEERNSELPETIKPYFQYSECLDLSKTLHNMHVGGALTGIGNTEEVLLGMKLYAECILKEGIITWKDYEYLRKLGKKIEGQNSHK